MVDNLEDFEEENLEEFELKDVDEEEDTEDIKEPIKVNANQVMLNIICEVGKINMPLAQVMQLKVGDSFNIGELPPHVKLKLNDVYIGEGVLVEVHGRLGVKITKKFN